MSTDPVADMLTRIRNALLRKADKVTMPASNFKTAIVKIMKKEGCIKDYKKVDDKKSGLLTVYLKYTPEGNSVINRVIRVSKPGHRYYRGAQKLDKVMDGLGISIVSTSKGVMSDKESRKLNLGGEVICKIY